MKNVFHFFQQTFYDKIWTLREKPFIGVKISFIPARIRYWTKKCCFSGRRSLPLLNSANFTRIDIICVIFFI